MKDIIAKIEAAGMRWLVRSHDNGYFANVSTREFGASAGWSGERYTAYAPTPEAAFDRYRKREPDVRVPAGGVLRFVAG